MSVRSNWIWFLLALVPAVASQVVRMGQTDPVAWVACDYAGRLGTLAVLAVIPAARPSQLAPLGRDLPNLPDIALSLYAAQAAPSAAVARLREIVLDELARMA
jgi:hypothetical protein